MKILIVTSILKKNDADNLFAQFLKEQGDSVSLFNEDNGELLLSEENIVNLDVIYITSLSELALTVRKMALKHNIPLVFEYIKQDTKEEIKKSYRKFYKYANAIHYLSKKDQDDLEYLVVRRTNGHVFDNNINNVEYLTKLRNMLLQYANEINHSSKKKLYYSDELNDDFAFQKIKVQKAEKAFKYIHKNPFWIASEFVLYHIFARAITWTLNKIVFHQSIENRIVLRKCRHKGYFIYANHTLGMADAFTPNLLKRKKNYIIVGREAVSIKGIKTIVTMLGAIPVYKSLDEFKPFHDCIKTRIKEGKSITIYPEAHIWPYYTKIRPFKKDSFHYPVELNAPVFVLTNTWQKRRFGKKPKLVSYISGPFYPNNELGRNEAEKDLRERVLYEMTRVTRSVKQVEYIKYIKVDK